MPLCDNDEQVYLLKKGFHFPTVAAYLGWFCNIIAATI